MSIGFRYTSYIADGDCKNHKAIEELAPYCPGVKILKGECANHLSKRAYRMLSMWGMTWTEDNGSKKKLKKKDKDKDKNQPSVADMFSQALKNSKQPLMNV